MKPKHREFYETIHENTTQMTFVDGLAGTAKTYIAVYAALEMLKTKRLRRLFISDQSLSQLTRA